MINIGIAIIHGSSQADASAASPKIIVAPFGTAVEALPDNPGQIAITLSPDYMFASEYEVHAHVSALPNGDFDQTTPIAPGETILTPAFSAGTVYPRLYLFGKTDKQLVAQTILAPIEIAVAEDIVAPVLSGVTAVATGTGTADGAVTTDEGSGHLYWVATEASTPPSAAELLAGGGAAAASGSQAVTSAGTQTVQIAGLAPATSYTLHLLQTDAAGNASGVVSSAAFTTGAKLPSGTLTLNELSRDKSIFDSGAHLLPLEKRKVLGLSSTTGSRWSGTYKRPGTDSLPSGVSYNAGTKTVTVTSTFTGTLEGWDFTGNQVTWQSGNVRIRNCILGERDGKADILTYIDIYPAATVYEIAYNDIIGPNSYGGASPAILYREQSGNWPSIGSDGSNPAGWVHHNKFENLTEDAIKPTGGLVEYNAILYDKNLDFVGQNVDPHSDAINPRVITHPLVIRRNYIRMSQRTDGLYKGANNAFRVVPNNSTVVPYQRALVYENVVIGAKNANSFLFSAETKGMPAYVGPAFVGNWVQPNSQGVLYPTYSPDMIWTKNINLDTGELISESAGLGTNDSITPTNRAEVPISGTAPAGAVIEARAVSVDDGGATTTSWQTVGAANGSGVWSGTLSAPRNTSWLRAEVRLKSAPGEVVQMSNRFAAGHVWARWSQSDEYHVWAFPGTAARETVVDDDALQIVFLERSTSAMPAGSAKLIRVTNATHGPASNTPASYSATANVVAREFGGEKLMLAIHSQSGYGVDERVNETDNKRWKSDEQQVHDIVVADGSKVGFVHELLSSGTPTGLLSPEAMGPIQFGIKPDGSRFIAPGTVPSGYQTQRVDWTLDEFYDWSYTRFGFMVAYDDPGRARMLDMVDHPTYKQFFSVSAYGTRGFGGGWLRGELSADGTKYKDTAHPGIDDPRGAAQMAKVLTYTSMAQTGIAPGGVPVINTIELHPNGDQKAVALGWTGGDMTTTRLMFGHDTLWRPNVHPKYTDVKNIGWNGTHVRAEIRDDSGALADRGRIWLYKRDGTNWTAGDLTGIDLDLWASVSAPDEITNGWQFDDAPCGVVGEHGAVPVMPAFSPSDLFSNYTAYHPGHQASDAIDTGTDTGTGSSDETEAGTVPDSGTGTIPPDDNPNPNVAASEIVAFDPAYWNAVTGFTPNGDGTLSVDLTTWDMFSNKVAAPGQPRIEIDASATYYEVRVVVTSPNAGSLGMPRIYAKRDNGYGAIEIMGPVYKSFPGGNVPTELIWTTTGFASSDRTQMELQFKTGSGSSGIATISDLSVKAR